MHLEKIRALAERELSGRASHPWKEKGNKYLHGLRTAKLALKLRRQVLPGDDSLDEVLTVAAWFHDLRNGEEEHERLGAESTAQLLKDLVPEKELALICEFIRRHDSRDPEDKTISPWLALLQDADYLDHFGSYDVWMAFAYGAYKGQSLQEMAEYMLVQRPAEDEGFLRLFHFPQSRALYREKAAFLQAFARRFREECLVEDGNEIP